MSEEFKVGKNPCPSCGSSDALHYYGEGRGAYCWSCQYTILSDDELAKRGTEDINIEEMSLANRLVKEQIDKWKSDTGTKGKNTRLVRDDVWAKYYVRFSTDESTGEVTKHHYPIFDEEGLSGFKTRILPKQFLSSGKTGKDCLLFGQYAYKDSNSKKVVICAGEVDAASMMQILGDYYRGKGSEYEDIPCLSPTVGESGSAAQIKQQYDYLSRFQQIIVCYDMDEAGKAAVESLANVLPKGKMFVMSLPEKDVNKMLEKGLQRQVVNAFFEAKPWSPAGIVNSAEIYNEILARAQTEKLPFPPMLKKVNEALAGGINYGYICNVLAGSGAGKSSLVNQCISHWMIDLDQNVGVLSLEAEAGEFGENLLSHYVGRKIALIKDKQDRLNFVSSDEVRNAAKQLFIREDGTSRLFLLDDRGDYSRLQEQVEELIVKCDCRIIVVDVLSDVFAGKSIEEVDKWMSWQKKVVKQYNCIIINVSHVRKSGGGEKSASQGAFLTEESIIGSGTQYRSAGINIALQRDKNHEDPIIRNTTTVHILKSRATGWTGKACEIFYDSETHTLWDKEEWLKTQDISF